MSRQPCQVFLSYSMEDKHAAKKLVGALETRGLEVLEPPEFDAAEPFPLQVRDGVEKAIRDSDAVICLVTPSADNNPWVKWEWETALTTSWDRPLRLIPVVTSSAEPPGLFHDRAWIKIPGDLEDAEWTRVADSIAQALEAGEESDAPYKAKAEEIRRAQLERMRADIAPLVAAETVRRAR